MSTDVSDIKKLIWHSLNAYSTWWSPFNLADMAHRLLTANAAPLCKFYDLNHELDNSVTFDLLLCLHSDRYFEAYKQALRFDKFSYKVYDFLDDAYLEAVDHPEILNRIEQLFKFFIEQCSSPKTHVLLAVFNDHPRYHQRIQAELNRVGKDQLIKSMWSQYGTTSWPILLSWRAPEFTCRCVGDMETRHYAKLYDIYLEFMCDSDLNKLIVTNFQFSAHSGPFWSQVLSLDDMASAAGFSGVDELFMGVANGSIYTIHKDAQRLALTKALNCPTTLKRLSQLTPEQGQIVRKSNMLPKEIIHKLGWSTPNERRQDLIIDMGI